jgi:hypothetical protein
LIALYMSLRVAWRFASRVFEWEAEDRVELTVARDSLRAGVGAVDGRSEVPVRERAGDAGRCCDEEDGESLNPLRTLIRDEDASAEPKIGEPPKDSSAETEREAPEKRSLAAG